MNRVVYKQIKYYLCLIVFLFSTNLSSQGGTVFKEEIKNKIDVYLEDSLKDKRIPGASFILVQGNEVLFKKGYGIADKKNGTPFTTETVISLGNSSKLFTLIAALLLKNSEKLDSEKRVNEILPWYKHGRDGGERLLLIKHLLHSTSGLAISDERILHRQDGSLISNSKELLQKVSELNLRAGLPGDSFNDSNLNQILLAEVLETIYGKNVSIYLKENFFEKAEMFSTGFDYWKEAGNKLATSYNYLLGSQKKTSPSDIPASYTYAFKAVSNAEDIAKFISILLGTKKEFEAETSMFRDLFLPTAKLSNGTPCCAHLFRFKEFGNEKIFYHHGFGPGVASSIFIIPERKIGFAILMNGEAIPGAWGIGEGVYSILNELEIKPLSPNLKQLSGLIGLLAITVSLIFIYFISINIDRLYSREFVPTDPKPIAIRFAISLGVMLFLLWVMNLFLPFTNSMIEFFHLPYNSSMYGWMPELFYSFLAMLVISFFWTIYYAMLLARNSGV
ncbi:MAG: serine hydrolase domain-containing protein [Leptospiraceae bacterium]|nr:serine hydrolase domain-containing protein [Leptospiraceae bacterium]